ncbi:biotin--[acetyl-CoA-carboxylase] ligase [Agriterribacter sp.]|uniref:biotin--[acetyl-CoA-carboxylase] ligase n=1 Tax=Agriterribacter sp. TaxID=2821509 RepID=UPI002C78EAFF|nr:biotin--[acetyl-CoA-carboxylase] ligase [Agriterribacter sp.]HRO44497.1 biotin--[acetyl-CoA-carboxylase] ligase [Agriterribacter sp.]HRQ16477.1 biotin--[acetyl-CoA-carboxylase] ligase [Agriterribacter sp.]
MQSFGQSFTVLPSIDSTNNYAMQMVHARLAKHGDAWFALNQTKGKGQRGKTWRSRAGENIIISVVTAPSFLLPVQSFLLNAAIALGTYDFFKKYAGDETRIKWPNDIYWRDRKAGGILIENSIRSKKWLYAVAGIGLNINQCHFEETVARPTSLRQITGKSFEVIDLAKELCACLEARYETLKAGNETLILHNYGQAMYKLNEQVKFKHNGILLEALVKGVTPDGLLIVETANKKEEKWLWGTAEWIL